MSGPRDRSERLVDRQLRKAGVGALGSGPVAEFVELVRTSYRETELQRRLDEQAFSVASAELAELADELRSKNEALESALASLSESEQVRALNEQLSIQNDRLEHLATTDPLTGLLNRTAFLERVADLGTGSAAPNLAVAMLDLDRFKLVNDTFGHLRGDNLLVQVATALAAGTRSDDVVARLGGDEFAVARMVADEADAERFAASLAEACSRPVHLGRTVLHVVASVGVALAPKANAAPHALLRDADTAMYRAKADPTRSHQLFDSRFRDEVTRRFALEDRLRKAVDDRRVTVVYQPIVDAVSGKATMVEALARWHSPDLGQVSPIEFIPAAERLGLGGELGRQILESAIGDLARWYDIDPGYRRLAVSVNVTSGQLLDHTFADDVHATLARHGLPGRSLVIEVTEADVLHDFDRAVAVIDQLRRVGVRIAIDDFGTGFSALAYLAKLPVDFLKLDKSFVQRLGSDDAEGDERLAEAIVDLALRFDLAPIAEGVETEPQRRVLRRFGCGLLQGYLFARPMPADAADLHRVLRGSQRSGAAVLLAD